ncbi:S9 family peptidase [Sphingobacterium sp. SGL-16]|uniref:S9 family peptidase n=1 Tax=Sphingobacterium sp. SGL-16 TaxID=2710883 RepID=UPI0013EA6E2B|nr:prolyl oligopeptidase family serine peptidase [Sphingobacterium sp. SGL-16]NGM71922.1 S9 family peptidase [Sphingobacterium sp. SGL-16]
MLRNSSLAFILFGFVSVYGQTLPVKSKYESSSQLITNNSINVNWKSSAAYYVWTAGEDKVLYKIDLRSKKKTKTTDENTLKSLLQKGNFGTATEIEKWNLYSYQVDDKQTSLSFKFKGSNIIYSFQQKILKQEEVKTSSNKGGYKAPSAEYWKKFNADSTKYIFGKGHQLYLFDVKANKEYKLSCDGEPYFSYNSNNTADNDTTKIVSTSAIWLGDNVLAWREDKRMIGEMAVINSLSNPRPTIRTYKFPMPGDSTTIGYDVKIWNTSNREARTIKVTEEKDQRIILAGQLVNGRTYLWADRLGTNTSYTYFLRRSRSNEKVELCRLDFNTGNVKVLITESTLPHVNEQLFNVKIFNSDKDILYWSERTGFGQYYHYDNTGKLLNKIGPKGDYVVSKIVELDTAKRELFLEVYGYSKTVNPYYKQYIKAYLDNEKGVLLTPEAANNQIEFSDDKKYILNTYSTANSPSTHVIRDTNGKLISTLGQANIDKLITIGWSAPEQIQLNAADDSTMLYGLLYKPSNFDPTRKYPIITSVYPGPQEDFVPQSFSVDDNNHQSFADLGFLVVQVPSRGSSPYRGLKFHGYSHGNMRDYALADNKKTIEDLAKERPYINLDKVGIFGHSGGGFMTATAMMTYPDFYKVGVAASGNYDPNIYTQWWGETYHGINTTNKPNYIPTTAELAPNLKGKLLLITGDVDTNVHPANTFRLANALIKANKFFDMMVLPGKDHGLGDWYYQSLIANYFLLHLK